MKAPPPCLAAKPGNLRKLPSPTALPETARMMPILEFQDSLGEEEVMGSVLRKGRLNARKKNMTLDLAVRRLLISSLNGYAFDR